MTWPALAASVEPKTLGLTAGLALGLLLLVALRAQNARRSRPAWPPRPRRTRRWPWVSAWLLGVAALALALSLRPRPPDAAGGVDTVLVLDVSRSMLAEDDGATRLQRAREAIDALLASGQVRRAGLVLAAGAAFWAVPLTHDRAALLRFVALADAPAISERGTDLAHGLVLARAGLCGSDGRRCPPRVASAVVLLSDGEHFGAELEGPARALAAAGVVLHAIAVGRAPALVPAYGPGGGPLRLDDGRLALSTPDHALLERTVALGAGRCVAAGQPLRLHDRAPDGAVGLERLLLARPGWSDPLWECLLALAALACAALLVSEERARVVSGPQQ